MKRRQLWAGLALAVAFVLIGLGSAYIAGPTALQAAPAAEVAAPPPPTPAAKKPPQRPDAQEQAAPDSQLPPQRSGGPDAYGYTYDDSSEPGGPLFNWIAATQVISALHGGDDVTTTITLPFPINFYGATYNNTVVSTNGNLHMFAGGANDFSPPNCLPDPNYTLHLGLIAPFWDDMSFVGQGDVYTSVVGLVPNRTFVIEWRDANLFRNDGAHLTYEVLIDENSDNTPNVIRYQYLSLTGVAAGGTEAVVGMQSYDRTAGIAYGCLQDLLRDNLAIRFRVIRNVLLFPGSQSGGAAARNTVTYTGQLINQTGITNSFTLSLTGQTWTSILTPTIIGPISNGARVPYTVTVAIPSCQVAGTSDSATLSAIADQGTYSSTVQITTSVTTNGADFTPASRTTAGAANTTVTYTSTLTNRSGSSTRYFLTVVSTTNTFTHTVIPTNTGILSNNASIPITVSVQIPANAELGATDVLTLTARQQPPGTCPYTGQAVFTTTLGAWSRRSNPVYARVRHALVSYPPTGRVYALGGEGPGNNRNIPIEELNPPANSWTQRGQLRLGVSNVGGGVLGDGIYIPGGYDGNGAVALLQVYHPETDLAEVIYTDPMPGPRYGAGVVAVGGKLYVIGGSDGVAATRTVYQYNPALPATTRWQRKADMPTARIYLGVGAVNGRIYALGGLPGAPTDLATAESYDPATDTWTTIASMPTARASLAVVGVDSGPACGGYLYALGGGQLTYRATVERYDPATNTWSTLSSLGLARRSLAAAYSANGNQIIAHGGWTDFYNVYTEALGCGGGPGPTPTATPPGGVPTATPRPPTTPTPGPCTLPFSDVQQSDYFYAAVQYLYCRGIVSGYGDNTFRPYDTATRAQLTKLVALGYGWNVGNPGAQAFADVPPDYPLFVYVNVAAARGVISGYACGGPGEPCDGANTPYFRPGNTITRGQLCKIIVNAAGWAIITGPTPHFSDVPTSNPFYGAIETAYYRNIISGYADGLFRWGNTATRGQLSKILFNGLTFPLRIP